MALLPISQAEHGLKSKLGSRFDNHEFVMGLNDAESGLKAFIAIHNTNLGPALGGTRMTSYRSTDDALEDVLSLSRAMTYKCALADLPYGGGKAVIIYDGHGKKAGDRNQVLLSYARLVDKLRGLFKTGTDVGISDEDVVKMSTQTSHMLGVTKADRGELSTSKVAALGVFYAMKATLKYLEGNPNFRDKRVAVKGVGKLGAELVRLLTDAGAHVVIADIDKDKCDSLHKRLGNKVDVVPVESIHRQEVDLYAPCALGNEFTKKNISELRCRAVVGGANNQLESPIVGDYLNRRHILYAPDYIANAGGLIYVADELEQDGFRKERVLKRAQLIEQTITTILEQASKRKIAPHRMADILAESRIRGFAVSI